MALAMITASVHASDLTDEIERGKAAIRERLNQMVAVTTEQNWVRIDKAGKRVWVDVPHFWSTLSGHMQEQSAQFFALYCDFDHPDIVIYDMTSGQRIARFSREQYFPW